MNTYAKLARHCRAAWRLLPLVTANKATKRQRYFVWYVQAVAMRMFAPGTVGHELAREQSFDWLANVLDRRAA